MTRFHRSPSVDSNYSGKQHMYNGIDLFSRERVPDLLSFHHTAWGIVLFIVTSYPNLAAIQKAVMFGV
jgi:hypothetical protein